MSPLKDKLMQIRPTGKRRFDACHVTVFTHNKLAAKTKTRENTSIHPEGGGAPQQRARGAPGVTTGNPPCMRNVSATNDATPYPPTPHPLPPTHTPEGTKTRNITAATGKDADLRKDDAHLENS